MTECECLAECLFFNEKMVNKPTTAGMMKNRYCLGDSSSCARYMVFKAKGKQHVPDDMFPNQHKRAKELIEELEEE
ncbi:MAG: hypothetical protein JXR76_06115 [Deltaproteobacteria bacterium]|nr:hypothetical protein [Deltaproteobacteria bacterium]